MNEEQILNLTREIGIIGTKVDNLAEIVREMKRELATKAEHAALEKRVAELEAAHKAHVDSHAEAPYRKWMLIGTLLTGLSTLVAIYEVVIHR